MKIFNIIYNFFAIIILLVFAFTAVTALSSTQVFAVATESMEPAIDSGSAVFVRAAAEYEVGDIITARLSNGNTFTHRICELDPDGNLVYTKGDANPERDPQPTQTKNIVGKVVFSLPCLGNLSLKLSGTTVVLVLAGLLAALGLARFIAFKIKKQKEEKADETV